MLRVLCLHFFNVLDMVEFCMQNEFSAVFFSLSTGREINLLFFWLTQDRFFPAGHHKYAFETTKMCRQKILLAMFYMLM